MHVPNQQKGSKIIYTEYQSEAPQSLLSDQSVQTEHRSSIWQQNQQL